MAISKLYFKQCKFVPTVTVLCTHNSVWTNVLTVPFYMHEKQYTQILNLSSPAHYNSIVWLNGWVSNYKLSGCRLVVG